MFKSSNDKGNPYHDDEGKFTSANGVGTARTGSMAFIPSVTSSGAPRRFFSDYSPEEKDNLLSRYSDTHAEMLGMIETLGIQYPTSSIKTDSRELMREGALDDEFISQDPSSKRKERKATIVLGLPGSGKSTITDGLASNDGAFIVDADRFKDRIPEFKEDALMLSAVHNESVDLSDRFRKRLGSDGYNMVIGKVGGSIGSVAPVVEDLTEMGYEINVILNDVPLETAIDRTIGRFDRGETRRLVPLHTLLNADGNIFKTYDYLLQQESVRGGKIYSNDVPKGTYPKLLKEDTK